MNNSDNRIDTNTLKDIFRINDLSDKYKEYILLKDTHAGFQVIREYPGNIRYKPPLKKDGSSDRVALIQISFIFSKREQEKKDNKIPIFTSIHLFSRYLSKHLDYEFDDEDCPTKDSIEKSKRTPKPIDLESFDEYEYDLESNNLQTKKGEIITGEELLDKIFDEHCNTIHRFRGLKFRLKLSFQSIIINICSFKIEFLVKILKNLFGRTLESAESPRGTLFAYRREDLILEKTEAFELFGYKTSKNVILVFSTIAIIIYLLSIFIHKKLFDNMTSNNLIAVCGTIVSLWILDHLFPLIILFFLNLFIKIRRRFLFLKVRI